MPLNYGAAKQQYSGRQEAHERSARAGKSSGAGQRDQGKHQRQHERRELWNAVWETQQELYRIKAVQVCGAGHGRRKLLSEQGKDAKPAGKHQVAAAPLAFFRSAPGRYAQAQERAKQRKDGQVGAEELGGFVPGTPNSWVREITGKAANWLRVAGHERNHPKVSDSGADADRQADPEVALPVHYLSLQGGD